jgi:peptidoglycan/xylan/chitin deacetylase (PgdA/CDA1 family)
MAELNCTNPVTVPPREPFAWPDGVRAAVSVSFDDARESQLDRGLPILDSFGVKATFYVVPRAFRPRLSEWKAVVDAGHEIGNHTVTHPCSGNFGWSREYAVEAFSLERMESEMVEADRIIEAELGVCPHTFAYPCGNTIVGRGAATQSYVPVVARQFLAGRGFGVDHHNLPGWCDLAHLYAHCFDRSTFAEVKEAIDSAAQEGGWTILAGHEVGEVRQGISPEVLREVCAYVADPAQRLWVDTVAAIAEYVRRVRLGDAGPESGGVTSASSVSGPRP